MNLIGKTKSIFKELLVMLNVGFFVCFAGLIQLETNAIYSSTDSKVEIPTLITLNANYVTISASVGNAYLTALTSQTRPQQSAKSLIPFILPILGIMGMIQSIIAYMDYANNGNKAKRTLYFAVYLVTTSITIILIALAQTNWVGLDRDLLLLFIAVYYIFTAAYSNWATKL